MITTVRTFGALLLLLSTAACGGPRTGNVANTPAATTVRVENQSLLDLNIFALRDGDRVRLGSVSASSTQIFPIPSYLLFGATPLRFLADPIGGARTPVSQEVVVRPGEQAALTIPPMQ